MSWHCGRVGSFSGREGAARRLAERIGGACGDELAWEAVVEFASRLVLVVLRGGASHGRWSWVVVAVMGNALAIVLPRSEVRLRGLRLSPGCGS